MRLIFPADQWQISIEKDQLLFFTRGETRSAIFVDGFCSRKDLLAENARCRSRQITHCQRRQKWKILGIAFPVMQWVYVEICIAF